MSNRCISAWSALIVASVGSVGALADEPGLLRTVHALDEARGYCLDIPGAGANARLEEPLQAHTCKYGGSLGDQEFTRVSGGQKIGVRHYDRCLAAATLTPGASLFAANCTATPMQNWRFEWGRLSPASRPDLCVSLASGSGEVAGTPPLIAPVYRRRDVTLENCDESIAELQSLRVSTLDERQLSTADTARQGLPSDVAGRLAAFGRVFNGAIAGQTAEIVAPIPTTYSSNEIDVHEGLAYGSHELQQLDIHTATVRNASAPMPSIVIFHGGGLIGGDKRSTASAANYFASLGYIGVNANYRLALEHPWPAGARDVGGAVTWLRDHVGEYGGDPDQIFVMGLSSGSLHAATYVFRPELMPAGTARPAGAILMSGPYTFDFENPSPGEIAYFGEDPSLYAERVVNGNVNSTDVPVLFTTAEWDAPRYTLAFAGLLREIVVDHRSVMPRYHQSLGHNHSSQLMALGTADRNVSTALVDFIQQTIGAD